MTPKLDPPVKKNAFVHKLYGMLNNPKLAHPIWWTGPDDSNTFALYPSKEFADALLDYFKHGNVASFVRQLHMYGFHKILDPQLAYHDKDLPIWEFRHSLGKFKKNDESSLVYIKRRLLLNSLRNLSLLDNENNPPQHQPHPHQHQQPLRSSHPHIYDPHGIAYYPQPPRPGQTHPHAHPQAPPPYPYAYYATAAGAVPVAQSQWPPHVHLTPQGLPPYAYQAHPYQPPPHQPVQGFPPHVQHPHDPQHMAYPGVMLPPPTPKAPEAKETNNSHSPSPKRRSHDALGLPHTVLELPHLRYSHSTLLLPTYPASTQSEPPRSTASSDDATLQFRKPWDAALDKRPRHPSLLFDPLAPNNNHNHNNSNSTQTRQPNEAIKLPPLVGQGQASTSPPTGAQPMPPLPIQRPSLSSVPIRKSVYDKLRPLLIELHSAAHPPTSGHSSASASAPGSVSTPPRTLAGHNFDSIGSGSLSIFSGASSISSLLSGNRSSFGSISYLIEENRKPSLVAPHERPASPQMHPPGPPAPPAPPAGHPGPPGTSVVTTIMEEREGDHLSQPMPRLAQAEAVALGKTSTEEQGQTTSSAKSLTTSPKPSTPLFKAKVSYLLDDSSNGVKRQKTEAKDNETEKTAEA